MRDAWRIVGALAAMLVPVPALARDASAMMARARALTAADGCGASGGGGRGDILVCGGRADRYRLPLPRNADPATPPPRGDGLSGAEALNVPGDCGPFGRRRCTKREALLQGYGGGRDPLSLGLRLAAHLLGQGADAAPAPTSPR